MTRRAPANGARRGNRAASTIASATGSTTSSASDSSAGITSADKGHCEGKPDAPVQTLPTPDGPLSFVVTHRPRVTRRLHLELDPAGGLVVVVPRSWPNFYTRQLLHKNLPYVQRFLARAQPARLMPLSYEDGSRHLYRGDFIRLRLARVEGGRPATQFDGKILHLGLRELTTERVRDALRRWYRVEAGRFFTQQLEHQQRRTPWARERRLDLRLRRMTRTWGTCNSAGVIRLNTHLVKAPPEYLDYVICHELCHLEEMNHGPAFYALQEQIWPNWRATRAQLRREGGRYTQE